MSLKIDLGEDKNYFPDAGNAKAQIATSIFMDDIARSAEDALNEARTVAWVNWINSEPLMTAHVDDDSKTYLFFISDLVKNRVLLFFFWDYALLSSLRDLRYLKEWHRRYHAAGLMIVGIHTPFFDFGRDKKNVLDATHNQGIAFPVVMDNDFALWRAMENRYWPRRTLVNAKGQFLSDYVGEGHYQETEKEIQKLLREISPGLSCPPILKPLHALDEKGTEIFLGTKRRPTLGNKQVASYEGEEIVFREDNGGIFVTHLPYFEGPWVTTKESMYPASLNPKAPYKGEVKVTISFSARNVYIVARAKPKNAGDIAQSVKVSLVLNRKPVVEDFIGHDVVASETRKHFLVARDPRMYSVLKNLEPGPKELSLVLDSTGSDTLEIFAFYFEEA